MADAWRRTSSATSLSKDPWNFTSAMPRPGITITYIRTEPREREDSRNFSENNSVRSNKQRSKSFQDGRRRRNHSAPRSSATSLRQQPAVKTPNRAFGRMEDHLHPEAECQQRADENHAKSVKISAKSHGLFASRGCCWSRRRRGTTCESGAARRRSLGGRAAPWLASGSLPPKSRAVAVVAPAGVLPARRGPRSRAAALGRGRRAVAWHGAFIAARVRASAAPWRDAGRPRARSCALGRLTCHGPLRASVLFLYRLYVPPVAATCDKGWPLACACPRRVHWPNRWLDGVWRAAVDLVSGPGGAALVVRSFFFRE